MTAPTKSRSPKRRLARSEGDLLNALIHHLTLLEEYAARAFQGGDERYLGEVAGKLRLLIGRSRNNRPLLLDLMPTFGSTVEVTVDRPVGKTVLPLDDFLDEVCLVMPTPSGGRARFSRRELVAAWAQQQGASHEDWALAEEFAVARHAGVIFRDVPMDLWYLRSTCNTVLSVGTAFLEELARRGVLRKQAGSSRVPLQ